MPNRNLRDVVAHQEIVGIPPTASVRDAAVRMVEARVGAILVIDGDRLAGIFTERDLLNRVVARGLDPDTTRLAEVMTPDPQTAAPDMPLTTALAMMAEGCYRHLPVIDGKQLLGTVSARDAFGQELAELERELERRDRLTELMI